MNLSQITAVVVTRGDRDITPVLDSLRGFGEVLMPIGAPGLCVYARWQAAAQAKCETVAVVDDDTIVDWDALLAAHRFRGDCAITCNMPQRWRKGYEGTGISLVGFGAILPRSAAMAGFVSYNAAGLPGDEVFLRECDRVWSYAMRHQIHWADVPIKQMDYSTAPDRMYLQSRVGEDYREIRRRLALIEEKAA